MLNNYTRSPLWLTVTGAIVVLLIILSNTLAELPAPQLTDTEFFAPDMVLIPAGTIQMRSDTSSFDHERPLHTVTIPGFELARNELTWAEWQLCEDEGVCNKIERPTFLNMLEVSEKSAHPVVNINIDSVNEYLSWINKETGHSYRLPSEAEWEYATRAGSSTDYYWGDTIGENQANCRGCGSQWDGQSTSPVGSFNENPFGLNDMHGNVWEWTGTNCLYITSAGVPTNGSDWLGNHSRDFSCPVRGGGWIDGPMNLRSAYRIRVAAVVVDDSVGFRLARTLP